MAFGGNLTGNFGKPVLFGPDESGCVSPKPCLLIGFLCTQKGTLTLFDENLSGAVFLNAIPVIAGQFLPLAIARNCPVYAELDNAAGTFVVGPDMS
jgi:hypothetical protein